MTTNTLRGEAQITIAGRPYTVALNVGAAAAVGPIVGAASLRDLSTRMFEAPLDKIPEVIRALLEANGHRVSPEAVAGIALTDYPLLVKSLFNVAAGALSEGNAVAVTAPPPALPMSANGHSPSS